MKRIMRILLSSLIFCMIFTGAVLASDVSNALYYGTVIATNNSTATISASSNISGINSSEWITQGWLNASGNNCAIQYSGTDVAFMPGYNSDPWIVFVGDMGDYSQKSFTLYTDDVTGGKIAYFPDSSGMSVANSVSLNITDNGTFSINPYLGNTSGNLTYRTNAFNVSYNATTGNVTGSVYQYDKEYSNNSTDVLGMWTNDTRAWDNNLTTYAETYLDALTVDSDYLYLTINNFTSTNVSVYVYCSVAPASSNLYISIYYSGSWHVISSAVFAAVGPAWVTINTGTTSTITGIGVRVTNSSGGGVGYGWYDWGINGSTLMTTSSVSAVTTQGEHNITFGVDGVNINLGIDGATTSIPQTFIATAVSSSNTTASGNVTDTTTKTLAYNNWWGSTNVTDTVTGGVYLYDDSTMSYSWNRPNPQNYTGVSYVQPIFPEMKIFSGSGAVEFPVQISAITTLNSTAKWYYTSTPTTVTNGNTGSGQLNQAYDIFIKDAGGVIQDEILITLYYNSTYGAAFVDQGTFSDGINTYELYRSTFTPREYIFLKSGSSTFSMSGTVAVNIKSMLDLLVGTYGVSDTYYVYGIELGNESWGGTGAIHYVNFQETLNGTVRGFNVEPLSIPTNSNNVIIGSTATSYILSANITKGGNPVGSWIWQYSANFTDLTGNGNTATPGKRTTSSSANLTAALIQFSPVSLPKAPSYSVGEGPDWFSNNITMTGNFTTGNSTLNFPGKALIDSLSNATATPSQLPLTFITGFVILAVSIITSGFLRNFGNISLFVKALILFVGFGICKGVNIYDFWMIFFLAVFVVTVMFASKERAS